MRDFSGDTALLSLNTATVQPQWTLEQCIDGCARHGIGGIAPWRDKLDECGAARAARLIREAGLRVTGLCRGGMFPAATPAGRQAALDDNRRAVDDAAAIGAECLILVVGGLPAGSKDIAGARMQVRDGIAALLEHARAAGMPLAVEPLHPMYAADRACVNTLRQANDLCDALGAEADGGMSASRSTSTMSGGIRSCRRRSPAPARAGAFWAFTSATGWCRRPICCSTGA